MRTSRSEYYLRKDFGFIDLGVPAAIGITTISVYEVLRRYVWRSAKVGNGISRKAYGDGRLVARIGQSAIAELLGITPKTVGKYISILRDIEWIRTEGKDEELVYILGERVEVAVDGAHCEREIFYADAICIDVAEEIREIAESEGFEKVTAMPVSRRVSLVKELLGRNKGRPLEVTPEWVDEDPPKNLPTPPNFFPREGGTLRKKFGQKKENPSGEEEREEGTSDLGVSLRSSPENEPPGSITEPHPSGEEEHSRSTRAENGNGANSDAKDHVVRRVVASEAIEKAKALAKTQREENLRKEAEKRRRLENLRSKGDPEGSEMSILLRDLETAWRKAYAEAFESTTVAEWGGKERGQVKRIIEKYNGLQTRQGLRYLVMNWKQIKERFKKVKGLPTVGFLLKFHDALIPEAVKYAAVFEVKEEWDAWWREHPDKDPPEELERRFEKHSKDMESLGLIG